MQLVTVDGRPFLGMVLLEVSPVKREVFLAAVIKPFAHTQFSLYYCKGLYLKLLGSSKQMFVSLGTELSLPLTLCNQSPVMVLVHLTQHFVSVIINAIYSGCGFLVLWFWVMIFLSLVLSHYC